MDKLFGNHAPKKVAATTVDGRDIRQPPLPISEPITKSEEVAELDSLIAALKARGVGIDDAAADGNGQKVDGNRHQNM